MLESDTLNFKEARTQSQRKIPFGWRRLKLVPYRFSECKFHLWSRDELSASHHHDET